MGRSCTELWANVHFVLKLSTVELLMLVKFFVFDSSAKEYSLVYLEGYCFIVLSYLVIILYGYTWFESTPILEIITVLGSIVMLVFAIFSGVHDHNSKNVVLQSDQQAHTIFLVMTSVAAILLIVDFILLIMQALGKGPGFLKSSRGAETA